MTADPPAPPSAFRVPPSAFGNVPRSETFRVVLIGGSAGGLEALTAILCALPSGFALPILVVQHLHASDNGAFARHLGRATQSPVMEPCDKERIEPGRVYTAPANYHMLVEKDGAIALSIDQRVNWSRPSIDVLFESAARAWGAGVVAVILSGASDDGVRGMRAIQAAGGMNIAQDPASAPTPFMPQSAIDAGVVDEVLGVEEIGRRLVELGNRNMTKSERGTRNGEGAERGNRNAERGALRERGFP